MWAAAVAVIGSTAVAAALAMLGRLGMAEAGGVLLAGTVCRIVTAGALIGRLSGRESGAVVPGQDERGAAAPGS